MHSFDGVRFDEKKAELNYNISLFLSLENNFGDFKGRRGIEQQGLVLFFKCGNNNQVDVFYVKMCDGLSCRMAPFTYHLLLVTGRIPEFGFLGRTL